MKMIQRKRKRLMPLVRNELYGPYQFLSDPEMAVSISYEVTYNDKNYLSICYHGSYTDQLGYAGDVGYAVTIDLNHGTIAELEDILP